MWSTHNYFGPGKSNYSTKPIDKDDAIAREHDLLYEKAKTFEDIHTADKTAIKDFGHDFLTSGRKRKDGRDINEGNIQYAYRLQLGRKRRRVQEAANQVDEPQPGPSSRPDPAPQHLFSSDSDEEEYRSNMDTNDTVVRDRRQAPAPGPSTSSTTNVSSGSSAIGGKGTINYIQAVGLD